MILIDVPNLDGETLDPAEMRELGQNLTRLASYALSKANAMENRLKGKIELAELDERHCEALFNTLPPEWRW